MSAGPGRAERAILDALASRCSPLGAPLWLTIDEIGEAGSYRLPLTAADRDSLRRAAVRLAAKDQILKAKAGERWAPSQRVASSILRPELRRGALLLRTFSARRQASDKGVSRKNTESLEGKSKVLPEDLLRPPRDLPQGIPFSVAGESTEEGDEPEDITAALILNGTSRTRVTKLQTDKPPLLTHSAPPDTPPAPRAFTAAELTAMGFERLDDRWVPDIQRRDPDDDRGWELLDDPGVSDETESTRPEFRPFDYYSEGDDDLALWERPLVEAGELDPYWHLDFQPPDNIYRRAPAAEPEAVDCVRCGAPAVKAGACVTHLCENCHEQPWHSKRLCRACAEYARVHKGATRPARLWGRTRKVDLRGRRPRK